MTSMRRNDVASTSFRRHVPTMFLINKCQIITFLILKSDITEKSWIELRGIVLPVPSNQIKVTFIIILLRKPTRVKNDKRKKNIFLVGTRNFLVVTRKILVVTRIFLVITRKILVGTRKFLVGTRIFLVVTRKNLVGTRIFLVVTRKNLVGTRIFLVVTRKFLVGTRKIIVETRIFLVQTRKILVRTRNFQSRRNVIYLRPLTTLTDLYHC